jgi:two-component system, OmpR family, response regulator
MTPLQQRVLVIDDDEELNALLARYLSRFNFAVKAVVHPSDGLRVLHVNPPDVVILDVMLPEMDGFAVCRKVRERSRVPIIMLTARGAVADRIAGLELGADDYLSKPFEPRELMARIQAVLRRGANIPADRVRVGSLDINWTTSSVRLNRRTVSLTPAEFQLLTVLVRRSRTRAEPRAHHGRDPRHRPEGRGQRSQAFTVSRARMSLRRRRASHARSRGSRQSCLPLSIARSRTLVWHPGSRDTRQ